MHRKHYKAVAEILNQELSNSKTTRERDVVFNIMMKLEDIFKADNPRFSPVRFREAVKAQVAEL